MFKRLYRLRGSVKNEGPYLLLAGNDDFLWFGLRAVADKNLIPLRRSSSLSLMDSELVSPDLCGVIHIFTGYCNNPDVLDVLDRVYRLTGLPQLVLCDRLGGLFRLFPCVSTISLTTPLPDMSTALYRLFERSYRKQKLLTLNMRHRQMLSWLASGVNMHEIAERLQVPVKLVYRRREYLHHRMGLSTLPEIAALYSMAETLLRLWPGNNRYHKAGSWLHSAT